MKKEIKVLLVIILIGIVFLLVKYNNNSKVNEIFKKKQECAKYTDLVNKKIIESGRIFTDENYTIDEIFYSPKMNTCLYAYTIHAKRGELYNIYDLFGKYSLTLTNSDDFHARRAEFEK